MSRAQRQLYDLFDEALDLDPDARAQLLDARCVGDAALRAEVESLLEADDQAQGMLEPPVIEALVTRGEPKTGINPFEGRRIGRYTLAERIGIGGMSIVYAAQQDRPRRRVAIKLLRVGLAGGSMQRRFEREAEILGRLRHPGIAQIYDAGSYESELGSTPFFAMELVAGAQNLTRYAEVHQLSIDARVRLFVSVCHAVEHAHRSGVVHRDLKPSNILVDSDGHAKLIDFGIARAVGPQAPDTTLHTHAGNLIGTLSYMSPEQLAEDEHIDQRSDVYSLGVVLFELLAGQLPYPNATSSAQLAELIVHQPPPAPSTCLEALRGDLETIILHALEKAPRQRYPCAASLARDLESYVDGRQITAPQRRMLRTLSQRWSRNPRFVARAGWAGVAVVATVTAVVLGPSFDRVELPVAPVQSAPTRNTQAYAHEIVQAKRAYDEGNLGQAKAALARCDPALRRWEWHRLRGQVDRSTQVLAGHTQPLRALVYAPQTQQMISAGDDGVVQAWSATIGRDGMPTFTPAWSVTTPTPVLALAVDSVTDQVFVAAQEGDVSVWALSSGHPLGTLLDIANAISLSVDPVRRQLAVGTFGGQISGYALAKLPELNTADRLFDFPTRLDLRELAFAEDGKAMLCVGAEHDAQLWGLDGTLKRSFVGAKDELEAVLPNAQHGSTFSGGWDDRLREFDLDTGAVRQTFPAVTDGIMDLVRVDPIRIVMATRSDEVIVWQTHPAQRLATLRGHDLGVEALVVGSDGRWVASASLDSTVRVWDLERPALDRALPRRGHKIQALAWLPSKDRILVAAGPQWRAGRDSELSLWTPQGEILAQVSDHAHTIDAVALSRDEVWVASASRDGVLAIRDSETLGLRHKITAHHAPIVAVAFSATHDWVASAASDGNLAIWSNGTGKNVSRLSAGSPVRDMIWAATGLLAISEDGRLRRWSNSDDGLPELTATAIDLPRGDAPTALAAVSNEVVVGDEAGVVTRVGALGDVLWRTETFGRAITHLGVSPGGERIVVTSYDYGVRVLDAQTGAILLLVGQHGSVAMAAVFAQDGGSIVSGGYDRVVRIWGI